MILAMISPEKAGQICTSALRRVKGKVMWGMSRYQWLVFFAAWLGWGFDVCDGLLFNFVAPVCVPSLLGVVPGEPGGAARVTAATGAITASLLVGWATGGVLFGFVTDRLGRSRTLLVTMLTYAGATAACALAPDVWTLTLLRFVASLGIGGAFTFRSSSRRGCAARARASASTRGATWPRPAPTWLAGRSAARLRRWTRSAGWRCCLSARSSSSRSSSRRTRGGHRRNRLPRPA